MREFPFPPATQNAVIVEDDVQKFMRRTIRISLPGDADKHDLASFADNPGAIQDRLFMSRAIDDHRHAALDLVIFWYRREHVPQARFFRDLTAVRVWIYNQNIVARDHEDVGAQETDWTCPGYHDDIARSGCGCRQCGHGHTHQPGKNRFLRCQSVRDGNNGVGGTLLYAPMPSHAKQSCPWFDPFDIGSYLFGHKDGSIARHAWKLSAKVIRRKLGPRTHQRYQRASSHLGRSQRCRRFHRQQCHHLFAGNGNSQNLHKAMPSDLATPRICSAAAAYSFASGRCSSKTGVSSGSFASSRK